MSHTRLLLFVLAIALLLPATAPAAEPVTATDPRGDASGRGLDRSERRALDVVSVTAIGERANGLLVTVTFGGNYRREIGQDDLSRAGAALVLHPKPDSGTQPTVLLSQGVGVVGQTFESTSSSQVGVLRNGRELTFFIAGGGLENVDSLEVKTFARLPRAGARGASRLSQGVRDFVLESRDASDTSTLAAPTGAESCEELELMKSNLHGRLLQSERLLRRGRQLQTMLDAALEEDKPGAIRRAATAMSGWLYGVNEEGLNNQRALRLLRQQVDQELRRLERARGVLDFLHARVTALLEAKRAAGQCGTPATAVTVETTGTLQGLPPPPSGGSPGGSGSSGGGGF